MAAQHPVETSAPPSSAAERPTVSGSEHNEQPQQIVIIEATLHVENGRTSKPSGSGAAAIAHAASLLKAVAWPLLAAFVLIAYNATLRQTLALIVAKLEKADKATIGSLSWEIQRQAQAQGGTELAKRVGALSPAGIEMLMSLDREASYTFANVDRDGDETLVRVPDDKHLTALRELSEAGLVKFAESLETYLETLKQASKGEREHLPGYRTFVMKAPLSMDDEVRLDRQRYKLTPRGSQAADAIVAAIGEQLRQN